LAQTTFPRSRRPMPLMSHINSIMVPGGIYVLRCSAHPCAERSSRIPRMLICPSADSPWTRWRVGYLGARRESDLEGSLPWPFSCLPGWRTSAAPAGRSSPIPVIKRHGSARAMLPHVTDRAAIRGTNIGHPMSDLLVLESSGFRGVPPLRPWRRRKL
jgi:hypothetical protein